MYRVFQGTTGNDYARGNGSADYMAGFQGDDDFAGGDGDDYLDGGKDNDMLEGGRGNDRLVGGEGIDAANYQYTAAAIYADLATGIVQDGDGGTDRLNGIEVLLGSRFADTMLGSAGNDDFRGGAGNDVLEGRGGDDILRGDKGDDVLSGGDGFDFADYYYTKGVIVDLSLGTATARGYGTDRLSGIEGVAGSIYADTITGDAAANDLRGDGGNDVLRGGLGDDILDGGVGKDTLYGGLGSDTLYGGAGADRFVFVAEDAGTVDLIADFCSGEGDRIQLNAIDANVATARNDAFRFIGDAAFSGKAGELRASIVDGYTVVEGDVDGDGLADGMLRLVGEHHLVATDFVL